MRATERVIEKSRQVGIVGSDRGTVAVLAVEDRAGDAMAGFATIMTRTRREQVVDRLRDAILSGQLAQGTQLVELKLATRLGVSRGSIREAIRELIEQGLLVSKPYGGTYVTTIAEAEMAELFQVTPQSITQHIRVIYQDAELVTEATCKESLQVQTEGDRQVQRKLKLYRLELILAVGYRVRSARGTQFRQWATGHLAEYLVKGFVLDDNRLKNPGGWDHFDELLGKAA